MWKIYTDRVPMKNVMIVFFWRISIIFKWYFFIIWNANLFEMFTTSQYLQVYKVTKKQTKTSEDQWEVKLTSHLCFNHWSENGQQGKCICSGFETSV